jgi:hypothetical protein
MTQLTDKMTIDALARLRVSIEANATYQLKLMAEKWKPVKVPEPEIFHLDFSPRERRENPKWIPTFVSAGGGGSSEWWGVIL